ncbi:SUMF1/EgtB/PvdO family nonheme iron enzyme [uncultured Umboniibacter sp.]|uniref:SUMF1/EgtB/PvdO family nonheme iron enzyme n=1 Tax=uncultured Umboniibacter sp. TaxID=1798917 RepID=UPI00262B707D|nr:SUMF1/EgtB/PvdO family nonheme iron enzyme [uncultured Umboniibacter sp.]
MSREHESSHLPIGTQLGEYEIQAVLGQGGFGITYKAWDSTLACYVALKEYFPKHLANRNTDSVSIRPISREDESSYEKGLTSFVEEARVLAQFQHPGVVPVKRLVKANQTAYMVMGFVEGETLTQYMKKSGGKVGPQQLVAWTVQLLSALEKVHQAGLLHRDIKPGNVYIGTDGNAMLLDFGAARRVAAEASQSITGVISAGYSPIEQYSESTKNQGPWTDIYSLSATLYRCITGVKPIEATARRDEMDDGDPDPLAALNPSSYPNFPAGFILAVWQGMAVIRKHRLRDVHAYREVMNASLESAQTNEPVQPATPPPKPAGPRTSGSAASTPKSGPASQQKSSGTASSSVPISGGGRVVQVILGVVAVAVIAVVIVNPFAKNTDPIIGNDDGSEEVQLHQVSVNVQPNSAVDSISINGTRVANGAATALTQGEHRVQVRGTNGYSNVDERISVDRNNRQFDFTLTQDLVPLTLTLIPSNARVILPDLPANVTYSPGVQLPRGTHRVRVIASGYERFEGSIDLNQGSNWTITLEQATPIAQINAQMVAIPAGRFNMGGDVYTDEKPVHRVNVPAFELQKTEVSWEQYRECVNANGCTAPANSSSFGDDEPVRSVSWDDVQRFISWLNRETGSSYRLPSEAEWEYAARAGSSTRYSSGNTLYCDDARYGRGDNGACYSGDDGPVEVGSYRANSFGLYDMAGNVNEWVEDCFYNDYNGAPNDGSAWIRKADCSVRSMRGGGWAGSVEQVASPYRNSDQRDATFTDVGFRLARSR